MLYLIAADIVVLLHFSWIIFLIIGAFPGRRYRWIKRIHIGGIFFAFLIQFFGWFCPLTYLEVWFRRMHDSSQKYEGSFIIHYVEKIVYVDLPPKMILILTICIALISALLYLYKPGELKGRHK